MLGYVLLITSFSLCSAGDNVELYGNIKPPLPPATTSLYCPSQLSFPPSSHASALSKQAIIKIPLPYLQEGDQ